MLAVRSALCLYLPCWILEGSLKVAQTGTKVLLLLRHSCCWDIRPLNQKCWARSNATEQNCCRRCGGWVVLAIELWSWQIYVPSLVRMVAFSFMRLDDRTLVISSSCMTLRPILQDKDSLSHWTRGWEKAPCSHLLKQHDTAENRVVVKRAKSPELRGFVWGKHRLCFESLTVKFHLTHQTCKASTVTKSEISYSWMQTKIFLRRWCRRYSHWMFVP
jgi:hypothetical protein